MQLSLGLGNDAALPDEYQQQFDAASVLELLRAWHQAGWLRLLDLQFARFLHSEKPELSGLLLLAAALASHQLGRGHVCLDLAATLEGPERVLNLPPEQSASGRLALSGDVNAQATGEPAPVTPAELLGSLSLADWEVSFHPEVVSDGSRLAPLVYDSGRLYLYRYWRYEQQVASGIASRLRAAQADPQPPASRVKAVLDQLFKPTSPGAGPDWQRLACALAARQRFAIITGGPGTGKTTTVVRLLALLQALHLENHPGRGKAAGSARAPQPLRIRLAAPTGKAAARLSESIGGRVGELSLVMPQSENMSEGQLAQLIPEQVVTLHRLLGGRPHVRQRTYNADNPLPLDVLVIDEASMIPLSDMADVIAALPPQARLVLIGDKDQLSSVEAGAVLGELCRRADEGHYLPAVAQWLADATGMAVPADRQDEHGSPLDQAVSMLRFSHRFDGDSGIGRLALAVNEGNYSDVQALLDSPSPDVAYLKTNDPHGTAYARLVVDGRAGQQPDEGPGGLQRHGYSHYLGLVTEGPARADLQGYDEWAVEVLQAHRAFQVLCVLRNGPWGVEGLNLSIARLLHAKGLISAPSGWYAGRPVMVTRNNPALRLTNGDIGVVLPYPAEEGRTVLRVAFSDGSAGVRWFAPNRLDDIETVHALTVHKSQGSEFRHTVLVLPEAPSPVLTRELVYTGITRASDCFTLVNPGGAKLLEYAVKQRVHRSGGLGDLLAAMG